MGGVASASASATEVANANITQQYSGTCKISCNNTMTDANITLINDAIGGDVRLTQSCSVNGQCMFNTSQSAITDIALKANTAASGALSGLGITFSDTMSYQEINTNIQQYVNHTCSVSSSNDMNNINIFAANSEIGGGVIIDQTGNVKGGCSLNAMMGATSKATAIADTCSAAGKSAKKKSCGGKGGSIGTFVLYGIVGLVVFVVIMMMVKFARGNPTPLCTDKTPPGVACKPKCSPSLPPGMDCAPECIPGMAAGTCIPPSRTPGGTPGGMSGVDRQQRLAYLGLEEPPLVKSPPMTGDFDYAPKYQDTGNASDQYMYPLPSNYDYENLPDN